MGLVEVVQHLVVDTDRGIHHLVVALNLVVHRPQRDRGTQHLVVHQAKVVVDIQVVVVMPLMVTRLLLIELCIEQVVTLHYLMMT